MQSQQPLNSMIFTNADLKYSRLDDKQGGDIIVTMKRVREAIAFNAELADESTWLWLTSEQMGFPLRQADREKYEERAEDSDSSQIARGHLVAHYLKPVTQASWNKIRNVVMTNLNSHYAAVQ